MPIALSHSDPNPKKRVGKTGRTSNWSITHKRNYQRVENVLDEVYCDYANGLLDSEIKKKLMNGLYPSQEGKTMKQRNAIDYINAVQARIAGDYREKTRAIRENLFLNYMTIYQNALECNDRYNAKGALDSIARLTGANLDRPTTAVQINNSESGITINFGFLNENNDVDDEKE